MNCPIYFFFLFSCLSFIIDFKKLFLLRKKKKKLMLPMIWIAVPSPHFIFVSWLYSWFFVLLLLRAEVSFLFSHVVFCNLDSELLIKRDFPHFTFANEFSYFFLLFLRLSFLNVKKKKKNSLWNCSWCLVWNMDSVFLFSPDGLFYNTIYWKIHLCLHICFNFSLCGFLHCFKVYFQRYCFAGLGCFKHFSH